MKLRIIQTGFTLVEIMVALVLGLVITGGVIAMFIQSKRNYNQDEQIARMQENSRYALLSLQNELALAGFWGGMSRSSDINDPGSGSLPIATDCGVSGVRWAVVTTQPIQYFFVSPSTTNTTPPAEFSCISASDYAQNTNALSIKRVSQNSTTAPAQYHVYVRTAGTGGDLFKSDGSVTPTGFEDWEYQADIFYIGLNDDGIPSLYRKQLSSTSTGTQMQSDPGGMLVEGVENFYVQFGIDSSGDGVADQYKWDPSNNELNQAVTARISILARTVTPDLTYSDSKTYNLGGGVVGPFNDHYHRRIYSTTTQIRNLMYQAQFKL